MPLTINIFFYYSTFIKTDETKYTKKMNWYTSDCNRRLNWSSTSGINSINSDIHMI